MAIPQDLEILKNKYESYSKRLKELKQESDELSEQLKAVAYELGHAMTERGYLALKTSAGKFLRPSPVYRGGFAQEKLGDLLKWASMNQVDLPVAYKAVYTMSAQVCPQELFEQTHEQADKVSLDCPQQSFDAFLRKHPEALQFANYEQYIQLKETVK